MISPTRLFRAGLISGLLVTAGCQLRIPGPGPRAAGAVRTVYALRYADIKKGKGAEAKAGQRVTVHYTGWLLNGKKFDSSVDRGQPFVFQLGAGQVIPGWDGGVVGMRVGGKRRLLIPYQLAYGSQGSGPIPPKSDLTFDVELLGVQ